MAEVGAGGAGEGRGSDAPRGSSRLPKQPVNGRGLVRAPTGGDGGKCARAAEGSVLAVHKRTVIPRSHALCGVLEGHLSRFVATQGDCVVWGSKPHIWGFAAPVMGLRVAGGSGPPGFQNFLRSCHPGLAWMGLVPPRRLRRAVTGGFPPRIPARRCRPD